MLTEEKTAYYTGQLIRLHPDNCCKASIKRMKSRSPIISNPRVRISSLSFFYIYTSILISVVISSSLNNVVEANESAQKDHVEVSDQDFEKIGLPYGTYLKNVLTALEKDKNFTDIVSKMDIKDFKSKKVAEQLKHVHEKVREELHDLKYLEIQRLRDLAVRKNEINQYGESYHGKDTRKWRTLGSSIKLPEHLGTDHTSFDVEDLQKLIIAASNDLSALDKERHQDFDVYEMEKEYQYQESLKMMNDTAKAEAQKLKEELKKKHEDHPKLHEPGKKQQLEEVWEEKEHLPRQEFNPKTYFALQDKNSDNFWDPDEILGMFEPALKKVYDPSKHPEDDPNEMDEEGERMREHIMSIMDKNNDGLVSKQEFLDYTSSDEFTKDNGWNDLSKQQHYTKEQYEQYTKHREEMMKQTHGYYNLDRYPQLPEQLHLPYGMPYNADPSQYYQYMDPQQQQYYMHQQQLAQQQQMAYHQQAQAAQAAYHQQAQQQSGYQQPQVFQQNQQVPQLGSQQLPQGQQQVHYQQGQQYQPPQVAQQQSVQQPAQQFANQQVPAPQAFPQPNQPANNQISQQHPPAAPYQQQQQQQAYQPSIQPVAQQQVYQQQAPQQPHQQQNPPQQQPIQQH